MTRKSVTFLLVIFYIFSPASLTSAAVSSPSKASRDFNQATSALATAKTARDELRDELAELSVRSKEITAAITAAREIEKKFVLQTSAIAEIEQQIKDLKSEWDSKKTKLNNNAKKRARQRYNKTRGELVEQKKAVTYDKEGHHAASTEVERLEAIAHEITTSIRAKKVDLELAKTTVVRANQRLKAAKAIFQKTPEVSLLIPQKTPTKRVVSGSPTKSDAIAARAREELEEKNAREAKQAERKKAKQAERKKAKDKRIVATNRIKSFIRKNLPHKIATVQERIEARHIAKAAQKEFIAQTIALNTAARERKIQASIARAINKIAENQKALNEKAWKSRVNLALIALSGTTALAGVAAAVLLWMYKDTPTEKIENNVIRYAVGTLRNTGRWIGDRGSDIASIFSSNAK